MKYNMKKGLYQDKSLKLFTTKRSKKDSATWTWSNNDKSRHVSSGSYQTCLPAFSLLQQTRDKGAIYALSLGVCPCQ